MYNENRNFLLSMFGIVGVIALGLYFLWIFPNESYLYEAEVEGTFYIQAYTDYEIWDSYSDCNWIGKMYVCNTKWHWEYRERSVSQVDNRENYITPCKYNREIMDSSKERFTPCQHVRLMRVTFTNKEGLRVADCILNGLRWNYIEVGSKLTIAETRSGKVICE